MGIGRMRRLRIDKPSSIVPNVNASGSAVAVSAASLVPSRGVAGAASAASNEGEGCMTHRVALERVTFREAVSRPPNKAGVSPGRYDVFSSDPDAGKGIRSGETIEAYDLFNQDDKWIVIRSRSTGVEEWVAKEMVVQVRPKRDADQTVKVAAAK